MLDRHAGSLATVDLPELAAGRLVFRPQSAEGATYAHKIDKNEAAIDWSADAVAVRNRIHGLSPAPGAHSEIVIGGRLERVKILRAEVVDRLEHIDATLDWRVVSAPAALEWMQGILAGQAPTNTCT